MESQLMKSFWKSIGNAMQRAGEARARRAIAPYQHLLVQHDIDLEFNYDKDKKKGA